MVFAPRSHNIGNSPRGTPGKLGGIGVGVDVLNRKPAISLKRGKIEPRLLLMINRKSHARFQLVPNQRPWMTLRGHYALCFKTHPSFRAQHENLNEDRPILSATKIVAQWLVSDNTRLRPYADICRGSLERWWSCRKRWFLDLSQATSSEP